MVKTEYPRIGETVLSETLPNGLRVCVVPKPGYRKRYAFFATRYGGMDMRFRLRGVWQDTPAGIAHYLEHKMFDTEDGNALQTLAQNGAEPNAFTANSMTAYYFDCTERFEENLRILLSFVSVPYFTQESVDKERGIIAQEIRMTEDSPDWRVYKNLLQCLYRTNPARVPIVGTVESIAEITADTLYACHKVFYAPSNMVLCVEGDVDPEAVARIAEELLPAERAPIPAADLGPDEGLLPAAPLVRAQMEVSAPQFLIGVKLDPGARGEDALRRRLVATLAMRMLCGASSPFFSRLYEQGLLNMDFDYEVDASAGTLLAIVGGESRNPDEVLAAFRAECTRIADEGFDEALFTRARRASLGARLRGLEDFDNVCVSLAGGVFDGFCALDAFRLLEGVTREDCRRFVEENLTAERMAMSIIEAKKV